MNQYAINLRDGRVILCTRETLANIDYYAISERVAFAIENGELDKNEVIAKIKGKLLTNQEEWDALLEKKTTQNVRHSPLSPETSEPIETKIEKSEVSEEFDMAVPDATKKSGGKKVKAAKAEEPKAEAAGEDDVAGDVNI